jgi:hypothetical protein
LSEQKPVASEQKGEQNWKYAQKAAKTDFVLMQPRFDFVKKTRTIETGLAMGFPNLIPFVENISKKDSEKVASSIIIVFLSLENNFFTFLKFRL